MVMTARSGSITVEEAKRVAAYEISRRLPSTLAKIVRVQYGQFLIERKDGLWIQATINAPMRIVMQARIRVEGGPREVVLLPLSGG